MSKSGLSLVTGYLAVQAGLTPVLCYTSIDAIMIRLQRTAHRPVLHHTEMQHGLLADGSSQGEA